MAAMASTISRRRSRGSLIRGLPHQEHASGFALSGRVPSQRPHGSLAGTPVHTAVLPGPAAICRGRSEEHTSELQSRFDLVCRLLLEKKNDTRTTVSNY